MTVTDVSVNGLNAIRMEEGRALRAYQDSVGVWTIGYGITNFDKNIEFKVERGATITAEQAEQLLYSSLQKNYLPAVLRVLDQPKLTHPQGAVDGGLSMHFNTGGIIKASWPAKLNAGDIEGARVSFESWNKAGGRVLADLVRRRAHEWGIITREDYGHLTGPEIEDDLGRGIGTGELLTALPGHPAGPIVPGNVATDGPPSSPATPAPGVLRLGSIGPAVLAVQKQLVALGYLSPVNSTFDAATEMQVGQFQKAHPNLTIDGIVGPATRAALARALALRQKAANVAKGATATVAASGGLWQAFGAHIGEIALAIGTIALVAWGLYLAWQHRAEIEAIINKKLGRATV